MSSSPEPQVKIRLLGSFEVWRGDRTIRADDWPRKKASALMKRLALERRLLKDQAIEFLWPEADPASAANNLYRTIHATRQILNTFLGPGAADAIFRFEDGVLSLLPSAWVDVQEFERLCAERSNGSPEQRTALMIQALDLYQGELLPDDRYAEWTLIPRERLYRRQREARLELAVYHSEASEHDRAVALLIPLLEQDRADETVHRELMRLYAYSGQRPAALRQYQACVEALAAEIDAPPAPETDALYAQILHNELVPPPAPVQPPPGAPSSAPAIPTLDPPRPLFVGRERELSALQSHLEAALQGDGRIILITGEAGQGKTSLMAEFAYRSLARYPELVIAAGTCHALVGIADPYLPFRDLIAMLSGDWQRPWLGGSISSVQARRLQAVAPLTAQAIGAHAPDLVDILVPPAGLPPRRDPHSISLDQRQVLNQVGQLLRALASKQPLMLLLDDLQWIDSASANMLFYLGRQMASRPILILGAYRPSEVSQKDRGEHPLAPVVQELVRYRGEIQVDLDISVPEEERSFIDALLDSEPNRLNASFREELYRRTKGHPLFTVELLRALQDQEDLAKDEAGFWKAAEDLDWEILPARVEAVITRRIEALPQELRHLLAVASVEGESFSVEVVAQVHSVAVRALLHQLSGALDRRYRLVREQGEWRLGQQTLIRYQFRHHLFQQYLYRQLGAAERRALHAEIAAVLERLGAEDLDQLAVTLAHHYRAAGDTARAVPYLRRAGDDALRRVALEEAVQFYTAALEDWQGNDHTGRAKVLHNLGESLLALGKAQAARDCFSEAEGLYAHARNRTGQGAMQRLIGRSYWEQGERAMALESYHRALALLEGEPASAELGRATSAISQMHMLADEYDEAITWGERALTLGRALDTRDIIVHALANVGVSWVAKGSAERGLAMLAESQQRAETLGLPHDACRAYTALGDSLVSLERYQQASELYERMLEYARKVQAVLFEGVALVQLANLDWWAGRWRSALRRRLAIEAWMEASSGPSMAKVWASNFLALTCNDLGQPEKARLVLAGHTAIARRAGEPQTTVPHLELLARCAHSEEERAALVREILTSIDTAAYPRYEVLPALRLVCSWEAHASGGDPAALARLEKAGQQMQNRQSAASLSEVQAYAAGLRQEWEQAVLNYEAAAVHWEALQRPYDLLRTLGGKAQILSFAQREDIHSEASAEIRNVQRQAGRIIAQLANELDEPEAKEAFLASPLVMIIQGS